MSRHLLVGLSTRAMAESAVKTNNNILTLDYFGDQDQKIKVKNHSLAREFGLSFSAENLLKASDHLAFDTVAYTTNLENHPDVIAQLAGRAKLAGNNSETIKRIRDWSELRNFCLEKSLLHPQTLLPGEEHLATSRNTWLKKPVNGGGGSGIHPWDGRPLDDTSILQVYVEGIPASASFVADGRDSVVIGMTSQLIGRSEFGVQDYNWCGNILPLPLETHATRSILAEVTDTLRKLTRHFGLQGIGGMDFIIAEDADGMPRPHMLEINPRYTGSMELIEWAYGLNIYSLHLDAFDGRLPSFILSDHLNDTFYGKGIVFARQDLEIKESKGWLEFDRRDIPYPGDRIEQGHPICTVMARDDTFQHCFDALCINANNVRQETGDTVEI